MKKFVFTVLLALGVVGTAEAIQATLNWSDDGANQTRVERSDAGGAFVAQGSLLPAGVKTFNQTGLVTGTAYCYRVIKTNTFGDSAPLGPACGTPGAPLPATGLSVIFAP